MQRTLASKSLAEGQMGIVFAAFLKLIIPFVVVVPNQNKAPGSPRAKKL